MPSWRRVFHSEEARIESLAGQSPPEPEADVALFVLRENYPPDIFTPLSDAEVATAVQALCDCSVPFASERLHAQWARHLATVYEHYLQQSFDAVVPGDAQDTPTGEAS